MKRTGNSKIAVIGWGRGMGHKGHMYLADAVITQAINMKADPYFFVSKTVGKDDPIFPEEKIRIYQKVFPQYAPIFTPQSNLNQALQELAELGYQGVVVVVGADQKQAFQYLEKPNKEGVPVYQSLGLKKLRVISRQETNSKYAKEEGPRATPMREILLDPNAGEEDKFNVWRRDMPEQLSDREVLDVMNKAESRLIHSNQPKQNKVKAMSQKAAKLKEAILSFRTQGQPKVEPKKQEQDPLGYKHLFKQPGEEPKSTEKHYHGWEEYNKEQNPEELTEFAPDEGGGSRKFIPWPEFIGDLEAMLNEHFTVVQKVVKSTIQARFVPHDPMEFGPTMLYSYYEARAGRGKGAVSTRGSIQVGKYVPNTSNLGKQNFITTFNLLKGHPFERHFDLTGENVQKIYDIIIGNTAGAYQMQPQQQVNEFAPGNGDDDKPTAEYEVYQCQPDDQFKWIGGPLMQTDNMGKAHSFAYFLWKKHPDKCFMVWQERSQGSRGGYGPKGSVLGPDDEEVDEAVSRRDFLKGVGAAAMGAAAGDASAIAGAFPTPSAQQAMYKAAAQSNAAEAQRQAALQAEMQRQQRAAQAAKLAHNTQDVERLNKVNYHGKDSPIPTNATWDGDSSFMDLDGTQYTMASRMPIKGDEPRDMKLISTSEGRQVYIWTRYRMKGDGGHYFYPAQGKTIDEVSDKTLYSYLTKVDADSRKHKSDPTKRDPKKASKSVSGFSKAFNKLDSRKDDGSVSEDYLDE